MKQSISALSGPIFPNGTLVKPAAFLQSIWIFIDYNSVEVSPASLKEPLRMYHTSALFTLIKTHASLPPTPDLAKIAWGPKYIFRSQLLHFEL